MHRSSAGFRESRLVAPPKRRKTSEVLVFQGFVGTLPNGGDAEIPGRLLNYRQTKELRFCRSTENRHFRARRDRFFGDPRKRGCKCFGFSGLQRALCE